LTRLRVADASIALLLLSIGSFSEYCPMASAAAAAAGAEDSHACCGTGISGGTPACCHVGVSSYPAAASKAVIVAAPDVTARSLAFITAASEDVLVTLARPRLHSHSPPLVLRI
jgi:hypothetical protein